MNKHRRRPLATISMFGITYLQRQNPYLIAWWSAVYPGFGHYMLNQYFRATLLTLSEVTTNTVSHINQAIVFSFCGQFEMAKAVLKKEWLLGYCAIYFFAIWDSYRSTLVHNKLCELAEFENEQLPCIILHPNEIQYLEQRKPWLAALYSFFFPCLGIFYNQRWALAFYGIGWWWVYLLLSHAHVSLMNLLLGNIEASISVLDPQWLLFMPSVMGGAIYYSFMTVIAHNRLYRLEQRQHLLKRYRNSKLRIFS